MLHMLTTLSESPSSTVFVATREDLDDGAFLVVKTFSQSAIRHYGDGVGQRLLRERCALEQLSHPNIIDYLGFSHDANNFYITLEHAGGGDLFARIATTGPLDEASARQPAAEICAGLGHMHALDFIHLDVKTENVLITLQGQCKLADFGSSVRLRRPEDGGGPPPPALLGEIVGTPEIMAPEVVRKQQVCEVADWWSYGCVLFETLTGTSPFFDAADHTDDVLPLVARILRGTFTIPDALALSGEVVDLMRSLITRDTFLRLGARPHGRLAVAGHAWFDGTMTVPGGAQPEVQADLPHAFVDAELPTGEALIDTLLAL